MAPSVTRIALVTGANNGMGLEIARQLGKSGLRVLVGARNLALGEAAAERLRGEGVDTRYVQVDLTAPATITAAAADIESQEGRLDILVNNAGVSTPATAHLAWPASKPSDAPSTMRCARSGASGEFALTG